jgi:hypothetical protein
MVELGFQPVLELVDLQFELANLPVSFLDVFVGLLLELALLSRKLYF